MGIDLFARPHPALHASIAEADYGVSVRDRLLVPLRITVVGLVGDVRRIANRIIEHIALVDDFQADSADLSAAAAEVDEPLIARYQLALTAERDQISVTQN